MVRFRVALAVLFLAVVPSAVFAQLDTLWLRQYDCGQRDDDWVADMAVDGDGSTLICGTGYAGGAGASIIVQKYRPEGTLLWTRVHSGAQNQDDSASALVVDATGNVYVCGTTAHVPGQGMQMFVAKYSPNGDSLWARTFSRGSGEDVALAMCLTSTGRVAVTGYSAEPASLFDFAFRTLMLNPTNGDTFWTRTYLREDEDVAVAICADNAGAVYVTGYSYSDRTDYDIQTIKYDASGTRQWLKRHSRAEDDYGVAIAWNPVNNSVSVAGIVYTDHQDYNYFTIAYGAATGDSLWSREYNRYPADDEDLPTALVVDGSGNTIVTGMSWDWTTFLDCATVAYGPTGLPLWVHRYDAAGEDDVPMGLAVDSLGQVFVAGYSEHLLTDQDALLYKLGSDGTLQWAWHFDKDEGEDNLARVRPRPDGSIIVAGTVEDDLTMADFLVCRLRELLVDFAALELLVPDSIYLGDSVVPKVVVRNEAILPGEGWVRFQGVRAEHDDSVSVNLGPLETDTVAFAAWYPDSVGNYGLAGWVRVLGDERPYNDSAFATLRVYGDTTGVSAPPPGTLAAGFQLLPNPARGLVEVRAALPRAGAGTVRLYDVTGSVVETGTLLRPASGDARTRLDLARLPAGVYFCRLEHDGQEATRKLVIQR